MPVAYPTSRVYYRGKALGAMYEGTEKVWEPEVVVPAFTPAALAGLTVWLDAVQYTGSAWPNLGSAPAPAIVAAPAPALMPAALNGLPVVRFQVNQGRIRGTGMCTYGSWDLTVLYVGRMWGTNVGRLFTNPYPPFNFLVGTHTAGEPLMYDNGWAGDTPPWLARPTPFAIYGAVCSETPRLSTLYKDGVALGSTGTSAGHDSSYNISGYAATEETCDCEVAELICYDRPLPTVERQQVEDYLRTKWGL